jgi:hypothetical protein
VQRFGPALARFSDFLTAIGQKLQVLDLSEIRQLAVTQINQLGLTDAPLTLELPTRLSKMIPPTPTPAGIQPARPNPNPADAPNPDTTPNPDQKAKIAESNPIPPSFVLLLDR